MPIVLIIDALGTAAGGVLAVIGSMGAVRVLLLAWRLIRAVNASRKA